MQYIQNNKVFHNSKLMYSISARVLNMKQPLCIMSGLLAKLHHPHKYFNPQLNDKTNSENIILLNGFSRCGCVAIGPTCA